MSSKRNGFRSSARSAEARAEAATTPKRQVIIATPVKDLYCGISPLFNESLTPTIKLGEARGIEIFPLYQDDAMLQRARNYLLSLAVQHQVDDLIWIDADIGWNPEDFFKLLDYPVDVVGGIYPKRSDTEEYPLQVQGNRIPIDQRTGLLEVSGLGTGFLRFSKNAYLALWNSSREYKDKGNIARWAFEILDENGELIGEDIFACHKLLKLGFKVYLDGNINCAHVGPKIHRGNFIEYLKKNVLNQAPATI